MKTNVDLIRKMGDFEVTQRTTDGMFDANHLLRQWNDKHDSKRRRMSEFLDQANTNEFLEALNEEERLCRKSDKGDNQLIIQSKGKMTISGRTPDKVWMHPYLFIKFAMWINPRFEVKVIKFVYDELIKYRNDAGDAYREMSSAVAKIVPKKDVIESISKTAQALNFICFNKHETAIRNKQDEAAMKELVALEKEVTLLINVGHIKTFDALLQYLRGKWNTKYRPALLG